MSTGFPLDSFVFPLKPTAKTSLGDEALKLAKHLLELTISVSRVHVSWGYGFRNGIRLSTSISWNVTPITVVMYPLRTGTATAHSRQAAEVWAEVLWNPACFQQ